MRGVPRARRAIFAGAVRAHARPRGRRRRACTIAFQFLHRVEGEADGDAEPVAQRRGEQARACRGADQGELGEVDLHRARRRPFADDEVELEVLHGGIEDLLHRRIEPVDLVDEEHVALFEVRQLRREVARLGDDRAGGGAEADAEFLARICARVVLPRPGGPTKSTWSSASPRERAA
jgi:hypothetical protein